MRAMRHLRRLLFVTTLALAAAACGGDDGGSSPNDATDAPPTARSFVGNWRALPSAFDAVPRPIAARNKLVYGSDHVLVETIDGTARTYAWEETSTSEDTITITAQDAGDPQSLGYRYHLTGSTYLHNAMKPLTAGAGLVNTWTMAGTYNGAQLDTKWVLRTDLTASVTFTRTDGATVFDGMYMVMIGDEVLVQVVDPSDGGILNYLGKLADDQLGVPYELLP